MNPDDYNDPSSVVSDGSDGDGTSATLKSLIQAAPGILGGIASIVSSANGTEALQPVIIPAVGSPATSSVPPAYVTPWISRMAVKFNTTTTVVVGVLVAGALVVGAVIYKILK